MKYVPMQDLAARLGRDKSTILRAIKRWEREAGPRIVAARDGGEQRRFLLEQQDAERFVSWYRDAPLPRSGSHRHAMSY